MFSYEGLKTSTFIASNTAGPEPLYMTDTSSQVESATPNYWFGMLDIVLSTILIVALYCGVPFLVAKLSKRQWSIKRRRIFIVCNAIISYLIIAGIKIILDSENATPPNIAATVFWSFVASTIFQHYHPESKKASVELKKTPDPYAEQVKELKASQTARTKNQNNANDTVMEQQISLDKICPSASPAPATPTTDKPKKCFVIPLILCAALLACSLIGNIYQYSQNTTLKKEYAELEDYTSNIKELSDKYFSIIDEYEFYHTKAVIVTESGSRYHTYDCYHWNYPIWIYNKEAAASEGYTPCKDCNPPQEIKSLFLAINQKEAIINPTPRRFPWKNYTLSSPPWARNTTQKKSFSLAPAPEETITSAATLTLLSTACRRQIRRASGVILTTCQPC